MNEDESVRIANERHAGIVIKNNKLLLMHRIKKGYEYWVLPGGHRRQGETGEEAVLREIAEETNIICNNAHLIYSFSGSGSFSGQEDCLYMCTWQKGIKPKLVGEEKRKNNPANYFSPKWVPVAGVHKLNILPHETFEWLKNNLI